VEVKSTLKVFSTADIKSQHGMAKGHTIKPLVGIADLPTDRIRTTLADYEPNSLEELHWHPIEAFYYVISGHGIVRDLEGKEYDVGPGTAIYAPAGLAGAHEWQAKDNLQLIAFRGTAESDRKLQFTVDKKTKRSYVDLDDLIRGGGVSFKSHY
jgi:mannose-6-phosphate isomerase-like protein (cupin superfamily)